MVNLRNNSNKNNFFILKPYINYNKQSKNKKNKKMI